MKVNDYVKIGNNIQKYKEHMSKFNAIITPLTPEETLEMFKGRFEELGYELHKEEDVFIVTKKGGMFINLVILEDEINFEVETTKVKNTLIDLIREFQQWYWRDK